MPVSSAPCRVRDCQAVARRGSVARMAHRCMLWFSGADLLAFAAPLMVAHGLAISILGRKRGLVDQMDHRRCLHSDVEPTVTRAI